MITALTILDKSMNHIGFRQNYLSFTIAELEEISFDSNADTDADAEI